MTSPVTLLGQVLVAQQRYSEAEPLLRDALEIRSKDFGAGHWQTAKTTSILGAALAGQNRFEEAEPLLLESYPIISADRGPHRRRTHEALQRIIDLYESWEKPDRAAEYRSLLAQSTDSSETAVP